MKPFKNYDEQLNILKSRGLIINDENYCKYILHRENYYALVNGYKDFFLESENRFIENTSFDALYGLFLFDRELRQLFLYYILRAEHTIKSIIAYEFAKNHSECGYLNYKNYAGFKNKNNSLKQRKLELNIVAELHNTLSRGFRENTSIYHYMINHEQVPIWVLINHLTLGTIGKFYEVLIDKTQMDISKNFKITPAHLISFFKILTFYRNICAHDERFYNSQIHKFSIKKTNLHKNLTHKGVGNRDILSLLIVLKYILDKDDFQKLYSLFLEHLDFLNHILSSKQKTQVLDKMGLKGNWKEILLK